MRERKPCRYQGWRKKRREEVHLTPEQRFPSSMSPWKTTVSQTSTMQAMDNPTPEQMEIPQRKLWLTESSKRSRLWAGPFNLWRGAHTKVDFLAGSVSCEVLTPEQCVYEGLHASEWGAGKKYYKWSSAWENGRDVKKVILLLFLCITILLCY